MAERRRPAVSAALSGLTLAALVVLVFALPRALPGDPLAALDDPASGVAITDPELRERVLAHYGLDQPLPEQFAGYVGGLATGDLGWSIARNAPVSGLVAAHLPWTLLLMGPALLLSTAASYVLGILAAWHRGRTGDRVALVGLTALRAIPEYVLATLLLIAFAVLLPVLPVGGARTPFAEHGSGLAALADVGAHLVLPLATLTLSLTATLFLLQRHTVVGVLGADHMLLAEAKGLPLRRRQFVHAGRSALLPLLTAVGLQVAFAAQGAVFVEAVFAYPGMGSLLLEAVAARDYPVLEGVFLVLALVVLAVNLLVDLAARWVDPRSAAS